MKFGASSKPLDKLSVEEDAPSSSDMSESVDAANDVLSAIASKDAMALDLALQRHYESCEGGGYKGDSDEEA